MGLKKSRAALTQKVAERNGAAFAELVVANWDQAKTMIKTWRDALKAWEAKESFERAYQANRMTVRTFEAEFDKQYQKQIDDLQLVGTHRFRPNSSYEGRFTQGNQLTHSTAFHEKDEHKWYHADRGLDSSAFAKPSNFATRQKKYELGLHDLSASLVNKDLSIFEQIHHKDQGAFFAFLPLPEMEDQALLYALIRSAKALKATAPAFYTTVHDLRAEITRIKLAAEFDMAIGYSAIPVANPQPGQPKYKLQYTLGHNTTPVEGETPDAKLLATDKELTMKRVDKVTYEARQQVALNYTSILEKAARRTEGKKNEIVIAIRQHNGAFPVYAVRRGDVLKAIGISTGAAVENGKTISDLGAVT